MTLLTSEEKVREYEQCDECKQWSEFTAIIRKQLRLCYRCLDWKEGTEKWRK